MHFKIILENFQNNTYSELEFDSGLTIIKGTNNQGKSTLRRALQAVIFNNPRKTKNYIQNGKKYCSVTIEVEGYKQIIWKKTKNEVTYIIDGVPTNKAGRLNLSDVYPDNPFTIFDTNLVNIIAQKERPLPFNQTSSQTFQMFEELYGILSTKEDIGKFNTQLSTYNSQVVSNTTELNRLHTKKVSILNYKNEINLTKLKKLKEKLIKFSSFLNSVDTIKKINSQLHIYRSGVPVPISITELEDTINTLKQIKQVKAIKSNLNTLKVLDKPVKTPILNQFSVLQNIATLNESLVLIKSLEKPVSTKLLNQYSKLLDILELSKNIDDIKSKKEVISKKISSIKELLPVCPTCNRPFT